MQSSPLPSIRALKIIRSAPGPCRGRSAPFDDGRTIVVRARWNDDNADDYLAGGWVRDGGREATAFIDGPELRGDLPESISLPLKGQAIYRGEAAGYYESASNAGWRWALALSRAADGRGYWPSFSCRRHSLGGFHPWDDRRLCGVVEDGIEMTPTTFDDESGRVERRESESFSLNYLLWLHTGSFLDPAGFNGDLSAIAHPGLSADVEDTRCLAAGAPCEPEDEARTAARLGELERKTLQRR